MKIKKQTGGEVACAASVKKNSYWQTLFKYKHLYIMLIPGILHYIIFKYVPIGGIVMAFQDYDIYAGLTGSEFVGLKNFIDIFTSNDIYRLVRNTFLLGTYNLLWGLPIPILFALVLNEIRVNPFKKFVQSVSYVPALISVTVVASMVIDFLSPSTGIINQIIAMLGGEKHYFMADPAWFRTIHVASSVWSGFGRSAVIYFSAISAISTDLYEAADLDGCSRLKKIWHITLPGILPTICTMTILNAGGIFSVGADKVLLLYNPLTYETADVFGTFIYRRGIIEGNFSYSTAAGLFENVVAFTLVILANTISKRVSDNSLW